MRPTEILDAQADLLDRLEHNLLFRQFTAITSNYAVGAGPAPDSSHALPRDMSDTPAGLAILEALGNYVQAGYAFRVTHDMCLVLEHAAASLNDEDLFDRNKAPTGCGIVRFDKPIKVLDIRGATMLVHWAVWGPATHSLPGEKPEKPAVMFSFYNDMWTEPDEISIDFAEHQHWRDPDHAHYQADYQMIMKSLGRWMSVHHTVWQDGMPLGPSEVAAHDKQQAMVIAQGTEPQKATNLVRYMHALWLLLNQTIVQTQEEYPERAGRRRAEKRGLPPKVTVIKLRRIEDNLRHEGESLIEWSHRWIVRGHWAWRRCSQEHPLAEPYAKGWRARVWIHAYAKGPEDAPLIISDKVYQLDR